MPDTNRRSLLQLISAYGILGLYPLNIQAEKIQGDSKLENELLIILQNWLDLEKTPPGDYLSTRGIDIRETNKLKEISASDFKSGRTICIQGLILSKSEAAVLAELATLL